VEQVNVGRSGLKVSVVGLGCNNFGRTIDIETSRLVVHRALDSGITLFDTADVYGQPRGASESLLGELLKGRRQDVVLVTKFGLSVGGGPPDTSRSFVLNALEASLKRLRTDYVDIYMLHWPDPRTPMEETLRVLDDIVSAGKARYIACSNLAPWRLVEAKWLAKELRTYSFICAQNEYSLLARGAQKELIPALLEYGMALSPYFPLAAGMLTGKYLESGATGRLQSNFLNLGNQFLTERNMEIVRSLDAYAKGRGHSILELAFSWLACQPVVAGVIAGATTPEQVDANVKAAGWKMTPQEIGEINAMVEDVSI
jgi:aryl-alcohol dehydrogenase-like predicted oxidoreductase